jgi:ABC-type transport system involved in multi-copper enzyme maturation permease subunit
MIWLTWRQFRAQAATAGVLVAALAVVLVADGRPLIHHGSGPTGADTILYFGGIVVMYALPGLIGAFWGAPLVARELEAGTHRLVWNQTVTRIRWLATKLAVTGLGAVAAAGLLSLAVTWWASPFDAASQPSTIAGGSPAESITARLSPWVFGARGIVPLGYALFAFVLGVSAGILLRRTVVAMAVTLGVFIAVQLAMPLAVRPHVVPPVSETVTITPTNLAKFGVNGGENQIDKLRVAEPSGAWVLSNDTVDSGGRTVQPPAWLVDCVLPPGADGLPPAAWQRCFAKLADQGYRQQVTYQPADRFWTLQAAEVGIYLALSALLTGLCIRWTRHRLS